MLGLALAFLAGVLVPDSRAADQEPLRPLSVLLDWFVNPDHGPLVIAQEKGYFREAGLEVTLIAPADPNDPPKLVAAGKADIAVGYQPQLHLQVAEGLPLVRFGTLVASPLNCLVALRDGPVHSLADLKGRKVGFSVGGFEDALLDTMLRHAGVDPATVEKVNVNFSLAPSVISGQVDAVIGPFRNFELTQMALAGHPGIAFLPEDAGVPPYDELVFLANRDHARDPRLGAFLDAVERAVLFVLNHPEESWTLFKTAHPELDDALNRQAWLDTVGRFSTAPAAVDHGRYRRFAQYLKDQNLMTTLPAVEDYVVEVAR
ncbi:ABC transporter ATP-binding protein [Pararhodospirillum oryzae]|uniref:ABC transporter ATP-binding protein n=2 Tax=Pararhodospirillum oryzae TaxID=478448 RepID=A0A512HBM1_9PROT|nr:ABC transporter ATP-binding protein [Pararhodospirillum oryzae]